MVTLRTIRYYRHTQKCPRWHHRPLRTVADLSQSVMWTPRHIWKVLLFVQNILRSRWTQHLLKLKIYTLGEQKMVQCLILWVGSSCSELFLWTCDCCICPSRHPPETKYMQCYDHAGRSLGCLSVWGEEGCTVQITKDSKISMKRWSFMHQFVQKTHKRWLNPCWQ